MQAETLYFDQTKSPRSGAVNTGSEADGHLEVAKEPLMPHSTIPKPYSLDVLLHERFMEYVHETDGCWIWTGPQRGTVPWRYGSFQIGKRAISAHRFAYLLFSGELKPGMVVRHTCDSTLCVNPAHLIVGSNQDNTRDMLLRGRQASVLSEADVRRIRELRDDGVLTYGEIAECFGVGVTTVGEICRRTTWGHVE